MTVRNRSSPRFQNPRYQTCTSFLFALAVLEPLLRFIHLLAVEIIVTVWLHGGGTRSLCTALRFIGTQHPFLVSIRKRREDFI